MSYTNTLLGFRELDPDELSAVAGGFSSEPGVGGGGLGGINFNLSPDRSILSISGSANVGSTKVTGEFNFTTQDPQLQDVTLKLTEGDFTESGTINVQDGSIGASFTENLDDGSSVTITFVEGPNGSETAVFTWNLPF